MWEWQSINPGRDVFPSRVDDLAVVAGIQLFADRNNHTIANQQIGLIPRHLLRRRSTGVAPRNKTVGWSTMGDSKP